MSYGLGKHERKPLWQEVIHKARVRLCRAAIGPDSDISRQDHETPGTQTEDAYQYYLEVVEDFDDGRVHSETEDTYGGIAAPIRETIPVRQLSKLFYTNTGKILNIGNVTESDNTPVLLLKRDCEVVPASEANRIGEPSPGGEVAACLSDQADIDRQLRQEGCARVDGPVQAISRHLPPHLDPEWIALEVFEEGQNDCDDSDGDGEEEGIMSRKTGTGDDVARPKATRQGRHSLDSTLVAQMRNLSFRRASDTMSPRPSSGVSREAPATSVENADFVARSPFGAITTSLSLIEMLIRLAGLQEFQQASHLSIPDHVLAFFLEESSSTGLTGEAKWRARSEAERRMGFDPYTDVRDEAD